MVFPGLLRLIQDPLNRFDFYHIITVPVYQVILQGHGRINAENRRLITAGRTGVYCLCHHGIQCHSPQEGGLAGGVGACQQYAFIRADGICNRIMQQWMIQVFYRNMSV